MIDSIPEQDNRLAVHISRILHPYFLPIPTTLALLSGLSLGEALQWAAIILGIILLPGVLYAVYRERRGFLLYQRRARGPLYVFGWLCVLLCLGIVIFLQAPSTVIASVGALAVWVPLQGTINTWVTKISGHAAVAAGCYTALLVLGRLETPLIQVLLLALVVLTLWARVVTKHHTITQVVLGLLVGTLPVLLVFPLVLF